MGLLSTRLTKAAELAATRTGPARARQLVWVAGELDRALQHWQAEGRPVSSLDELFLPVVLETYLALADAGELRRRSAKRPRSTVSARRVRVTCLHLLAAAAGLPAPLLAPDPPPRPRVRRPEPAAHRALLDNLADAAKYAPPAARPARIRAWALAGVVVDTSARTGELATMRVADIDDGRRLWVARAPQGSSEAPRRELVALSEATRVALADWLDVRRPLLVGRGSGALWVSVAPNHDASGQPRPAGLPLRPRGLARAWARTVREVNVALAGTPGFSPLPLTLEALRHQTAPVVEAP